VKYERTITSVCYNYSTQEEYERTVKREAHKIPNLKVM
jgi:hypothetical protein